MRRVPAFARQELKEVRNIDIAPTVLSILDVEPAKTVQGKALKLCPQGRPPQWQVRDERTDSLNTSLVFLEGRKKRMRGERRQRCPFFPLSRSTSRV